MPTKRTSYDSLGPYLNEIRDRAFSQGFMPVEALTEEELDRYQKKLKEYTLQRSATLDHFVRSLSPAQASLLAEHLDELSVRELRLLLHKRGA